MLVIILFLPGKNDKLMGQNLPRNVLINMENAYILKAQENCTVYGHVKRDLVIYDFMLL
jgi:hypothetical protein